PVPGALAPGVPLPGGIADSLRPVWNWITTHLTLVISLGVLAAVVLISLGLLLTWVRCRATFVFLDNLSRNEAAISAPWAQYGRLGDSLFVFGIVLAAIALASYAAR